MVCPKCSSEQPDGKPECAGCGVIFAKVKSPAEKALPNRVHPAAVVPGYAGILSFLRKHALSVEPGEPPFFIAGRGILLAILLVWGWRFITASIASGYASDSPLHLVHLPFHEAGHVIFGLLGMRFLTVLGGTLGQLLIPVVVIGAFLRRRNPFAASVGLWWLPFYTFR